MAKIDADSALHTWKLIREIESRHSLPVRNGLVHPTRAFLGELATAIGSTVTGAYQAWVVVAELVDRVAEAERESAEIAFWYGVNPFNLSARGRLGLVANLDRMKAQGRLHEGNFDPSDWDGVYDLVLLATGNRSLAAKARGDAIEHYIASKRG